VHPIEHLRWVARSPEGEAASVVAEAAAALATFADEPAGLVTACRRLIQRRPEAAPLWWLCARVLTAFDPDVEAWEACSDIESDPTGTRLAEVLPPGRLVVGGWPEQSALALATRPPGAADEVVVVTPAGLSSSRRLHWLERAGVDLVTVPPGAAREEIRGAALVLLEAEALGPAGFVATTADASSLATAAAEARVPVWLVAGTGRALPGPMFDALAARLDPERAPVLPLDVLDAVATPTGPATPAVAARRSTCPVAPELLRF
jgi:hypothetical protein